MPTSPTRRSVLRLAGAAAAWGLFPSGEAAAQVAPGTAAALLPGLRFRTVAIDTAPLARLGVPRTADLVAADLAREMRDVFGDLIAARDAGGAALVARVSSLYLTSFTGNRAYNGRSGGSGHDSLEGVGIVTVGGRVLAEVPMLATLDPGYSGAWYRPDIDALRVTSLCHQFAWWLRREMGV